MTFQVDLFWSFRSPYSYLATPRLVEMQRDFDVEITVRPVYPIALRIPGFFKKVNPLWPPYLLRDCARIAEMNGLPFAWPSPDPIVQDIATMEVAADPQGFDADIERNEAGQKAAGHWGVPLMVFRGEPFFGQDRIDVLLWRMQKAGLARRN